MSEENNNEELRPRKMRGVAFPKAKYGAIIMFVVLGLIPGYIIAKILHGMGKLRIPREVEIAGLDYEIMETAKSDEKAVASATR